jgi:hypothetical protein
MTHCNMQFPSERFTGHAALAVIGTQIRHWNLFVEIGKHVKIQQKKVRYTPVEKLFHGFVAILAGARGMVEINKRLQSDPGLQAAFGGTGCAEQSVVQDTLDACTEENVTQMQTALNTLYQRHGAGYRHNYQAQYQVLDIDMSGLVCGPKAAFATKGYFAKQRNRRGRQLGRVLATHYNEIVVDRLFDGKTQLVTALPQLVEAAEQTLDLDDVKRARTILRVDSGGGSVADINWALKRGYHYHGKDYSGQRANALAATVTEWIDDPRVPERQVGWITAPATDYVRPVRRIAVRCRKKNGQWGIGVLLSTLTPEMAIALTNQPCHTCADPLAVLLAYVYFYDVRSGGVETSFKEDRQGLGMHQRSKKRFPAQQMLTQLNLLAHNVVTWVKARLTPHVPAFRHLGLKRWIRDIFQMLGILYFDHTGRLYHCRLNQADPFARKLAPALCIWLADQHVGISLGET